RPQRGPSVRAGLFRKDEFRYDPTSDSFLCPAGQRLHPYSSSLTRGLKKINYRNSQACRDCPVRSQCTGNQFRSVYRLENEAVLDRMQARIAQRPDILDQRRETVEHPFGTIKQWMNQGAFLMRGLEKVRGEFSLTALAYNLRRVLNLVAFTDLMAALTAWKARACVLCKRVSTPSPRITSWDGTFLQNRLHGTVWPVIAFTVCASTDEASISARRVFTRPARDLQVEFHLRPASRLALHRPAARRY